MYSFKVLAIACLVVAKVRALPVAQPQPDNDLFAGFLRNAQLGTESKDSEIVKRRVYEDNPDREVKQISLQSLIGDFEDSLFASALSVQHIVNDKTATVQEIKPSPEAEEHQVNKRGLVVDTSSSVETSTTTPIAAEGEERKVILQTTERVPESAGVPAHILIDRISIQPQLGTSFPLIPSFEFKHTHQGNSDNGSEITKISISKTEITSVPNTPASLAPTTTATTPTGATTSTATNTATEHESTTATNIEQLKEAELELKEKVAEIEAEPVILSARV